MARLLSSVFFRVAEKGSGLVYSRYSRGVGHLAKSRYVFQILLANFKFQLNFIQISYFCISNFMANFIKSCSFNTLMMFFNFKGSLKRRKGQDQ